MLKNNRILYTLIFYLLCLTSIQAQTSNHQVWWKETVFYQIYMPSFQDSDSNGYSDFKGLTSRLDYLNFLGVKGIWLTPFMKSPKVDNGYDIADYYIIDSVYGNHADFRIFLDKAHNLGIKVIMDMVINHTSTDCQWFVESRKSKDNPYRDYYLWSDTINNWESFFGGSAWEFDPQTNQYYYHKFDVRMADLNWTNPSVAEEVSNVLRYWLDLGIDGFRMDVINFLLTDGVGPDNPVIDGKQQHLFDIDQPGVIDAMRFIKDVINDYEDRFVVGEIGSDKLHILSTYQSPVTMDVVFNFNFGSIETFSVQRICNELKNMDSIMPDYPTLFFGSHDMPRVMNRLANGSLSRARALAALILTAKGVPFIYYGDEIGMQNITANSFDEIVDIQGKTHYHLALESNKTIEEALLEGNKHNRDKSRSPMQWNSSSNAGFTSGVPWIKIHENYPFINVANAISDTNSLLYTYKGLINLRNNERVLQYGEMQSLKSSNDMLQFTRSYRNENITVVINFGEPLKYPLLQDAEILMGAVYLKTDDFLIFKH